MYLAFGFGYLRVTTPTREGIVSEQRWKSRVLRKVQILTFFSFTRVSENKNYTKYPSSHWKHATGSGKQHWEKLWFKMWIVYVLSFYISVFIALTLRLCCWLTITIIIQCGIIIWSTHSGKVRVFQRRRFSKGQNRPEDDWGCGTRRQAQAWRHTYRTNVRKHWLVKFYSSSACIIRLYPRS